MVMTISVRTSSGRPVSSLGRDIEIGVREGGRKAITNIARMITRQMKVEVPIWDGNLRNSIKSRSLSENEVAVFMNFYGAFVAKGHDINATPPTFMRWIRDKFNPELSDTPEQFAERLLGTRTEPNDFITRSLMKVQDKYGPEALKAIQKSLMDRGFKRG